MANQYLLQENDIFRLDEGMNIYAFVPEKFIFVNTPFSNKFAEHAICIGQPLRKRIPNVDNPNVKVHFYQTGYFTVKNSDIKPIR